MSEANNAKGQREKYGAIWPKKASDLLIEIGCIKNGGSWTSEAGVQCGKGLLFHYRRLQEILWPEKIWHRWNELVLEQFVNHDFIVLAGPKNSAKTREASDFALTMFFVFQPDITVLISTTDMRSLELRIWGEIKKSFRNAKKLHPELPGYMLHGAKAISAEKLEEADDIRDLRNGIIGIPATATGNDDAGGMGRYIGIKNQYVVQVADELQQMDPPFLNAISNLSGNPNYKCIGIGNPKDRYDVLGNLSEPHKDLGGWEAYQASETTTVWRTVWPNGVVVNLVGTDSPNFDFPDRSPPYPFLIKPSSIAVAAERYGRDSWQFTMQSLGVFPVSAQAKRVLTRQFCEQHLALDEPDWDDGKLIHLASLDAAYSSIGGDRCVLIFWSLGRNIAGKQILAQRGNPIIVPASPQKQETVEDQIAAFVRQKCMDQNIPPENFGYDGTGRSSLTSAFARLWSPFVVPIEFGGQASERPVSKEINTLCRDYYVNFCTELWYQFRMAIEAEQIRGLSINVVEEGCLRGWDFKGKRIKVEPKEETKERMGRSPDLMDSAVCGLEIARRHGFEIGALNVKAQRSSMAWLYGLKERHQRAARATTLVPTV